MRNTTRLIGLAALVAASVSCGDVVRQGSSPVFLVIDSLAGIPGSGPNKGTESSTLASDVITDFTTPLPCTDVTPCPTPVSDAGKAILRTALKDAGPTGTLAPSTNNEVTITRVHVEFSRADGRNTPGVDVPFPFDNAVTLNVVGQASPPLFFELVTLLAKEQAPLALLRNSPAVISSIATVTFYGVDRVGNAIQATGHIQVDFANFRDQ